MFGVGDRVTYNCPGYVSTHSHVRHGSAGVITRTAGDGFYNVDWGKSYVTMEHASRLLLHVEAVVEDGIVQANLITEAAIAKAKAGANEDWYRAASKALVKVAKSKAYFTTDDIWALIPVSVTTPEPRAMGAIMIGATKSGLASRSSTTERSTRPECHRRPLTVWHSNVVGKR